MVRKILQKVNCLDCSACLVKDKVTNSQNSKSLIDCKDRGGLVHASASVIRICKLAEHVIREKSVKENFVNNKNILNSMKTAVFNKCVGLNIFNSNHFVLQEPDQNHFTMLMTAIVEKYLKVRMHHFSKIQNEKLLREKVRSHLTKTITFLGQ